MKNAINLLYIAVLMIIFMGMAFYFYEVHRYDEKYKTYEGAFVNGFEYVMFVSCVEIEEIDNTVKGKYTTDIYVDGIDGFSERYSKYFLNEYEPVYLKVRAEISKNDGHTWMRFSHSLIVKEVIDIQLYDKRKCEPPYKPGVPKIKSEYPR